MSNKNGLILIAHGSKNNEANKYVADLTAQLIATCHDKYDFINFAFLQFANPTIEDAVSVHIQKEIKNIYIFPFFLGPGNHVLTDIPNSMNQLKIKHPTIHFSILPAFGCANNIATWIKSLV